MKVLDISKNFLGISAEYSDFETSKIVILSAPFEKTTSYGKGTVNGPKEILKASHYVEFYDEETDKELCFENGICTLEPLKFGKLTSKSSLDKIYKKVDELVKAKKFVVTLGGEHSISSAVIKAHNDNYEDLSILHFDAHSDLRQSYEGTIYSHASVMHRVIQFNKKLIQIGIRAQCIEESKLIRDSQIKTFYAFGIKQGKYGINWIDEVIKSLTDNVFISFDVDFWDPSIMPSTGTPEPGGFLWDETLAMLKPICAKKNIVGFDVVELAPKKGLDFPNFLTAKFVYKLLNYIFYKT